MRKLIALVISTILVLGSTGSVAQSKFAYYGFEPDIITNYINNRPKLGYVRLTVDLMINNVNNLEVVEHHAPLLRDAIISVLGREPEEKIRSLTGREEVRLKCVREIQRLLKKETGDEIIKDVLFTKYLYN